jgi:hypothetical protein
MRQPRKSKPSSMWAILFFFRQAQAYRGERRRDFLAQSLCVGSGACHRYHEESRQGDRTPRRSQNRA